MQNNNFTSEAIVEYAFEIDRYEVITSRRLQRFLKLVFKVWNENENFEEDQLYLLDENDCAHSSYYDFVDQFRQFREIKDEFFVEDLISERGTCYFKTNFSSGKVYKKIVLTSWGDSENE